MNDCYLLLANVDKLRHGMLCSVLYIVAILLAALLLQLYITDSFTGTLSIGQLEEHSASEKIPL